MKTRCPQICPLCEEGLLRPTQRTEKAEWKQHVFEVTYEYSICPVCGSEVTTPRQSRANDVRLRDGRRRAEGLLTGPEIRAIRRGCGLTQERAAELFGGGPNSFSKYERGEVTQSVAMDRLLRLAVDMPLIIPQLRRYTEKFAMPVQTKTVLSCTFELESEAQAFAPKQPSLLIRRTEMESRGAEWVSDNDNEKDNEGKRTYG
jgi:HTH-type transcriptional regulator/antitoxin MqsA